MESVKAPPTNMESLIFSKFIWIRLLSSDLDISIRMDRGAYGE